MDGARILGFYFPRRAKKLGLNGSIIYALLKEPDQRDEYRRVSPLRVSLSLPWISVELARKELENLWHCGAIQRERCKFKLSAGKTGYRYFWAKRTKEDRGKWAQFQRQVRASLLASPDQEATTATPAYPPYSAPQLFPAQAESRIFRFRNES